MRFHSLPAPAGSWSQFRPPYARLTHLVTTNTATKSTQPTTSSDHEQRRLDTLQLERSVARLFRAGNLDRISQTVNEQDVWLEANNITACFKALAEVEQPDNGNMRQEQAQFLDELCTAALSALPALHPPQLVTLLWACGRLNKHPGPLLIHIAEQLVEHVHKLRAKQLAQVAWSMAKLETPGIDSAASKTLLDAVSDASITCADKFTAQGITNLAWGYGKLLHPADAMLTTIAPLAAARIDEFTPQGLCNMLYGYAVLEQPLGPELAAVVPAAVESRLPQFTPQGLSLSMWALSSLKDCEVSDHLLERAAQQAVVLAADFSPLDISNLLVSFARYGFRAAACVEALSSTAHHRQMSFGRRSTIGTFWSLGKLAIRSPMFLDMLTNSVERYAADLDLGELRIALMSFARLNHVPQQPHLLPFLMERATAQVADMSGLQMANIAWAAARLPALEQTEPLAVALADEFCRRVWQQERQQSHPPATPQDVANMLWAQTMLGLTDRRLCAACIAVLAGQLDALRMKDISMLLHNLAKVRYQGRGTSFRAILQQSASALRDHVSTATAREVATVMWGLARLAPGMPALSPQVSAVVAKRLPEFNSQDLVFVAYACSRLRNSDSTLAEAVAAETEARGVDGFRFSELAEVVKSLAQLKRLTPRLISTLQTAMAETPERFERWHFIHLQKSIKLQQRG